MIAELENQRYRAGHDCRIEFQFLSYDLPAINAETFPGFFQGSRKIDFESEMVGKTGSHTYGEIEGVAEIAYFFRGTEPVVIILIGPIYKGIKFWSMHDSAQHEEKVMLIIIGGGENLAISGQAGQYNYR